MQLAQFIEDSTFQIAHQGIVQFDLLREALSKGNRLKVNVVGNSMHPLLTSESTIIVVSATMDEIRKGDIILYCRDSTIVSHRFFRKIKIDGAHFLQTKADISLSPDPLIRPDQLLGKVVAIEKDGRVVGLDTPLGRILGTILCFPIVTVSYYLILRLLRQFAFKMPNIKSEKGRQENVPK